MPPAAKTSITLTASAEAVLKRNNHLENKSARISEIITRYGMLLNMYRNEWTETFIDNDLVRIAILEWGKVYPIPAMRLRNVLGLVVNERLNSRQDLPSKEEVNSLYEQSAKLDPMEEMMIVEAIEASASREGSS